MLSRQTPTSFLKGRFRQHINVRHQQFPQPTAGTGGKHLHIGGEHKNRYDPLVPHEKGKQNTRARPHQRQGVQQKKYGSGGVPAGVYRKHAGAPSRANTGFPTLTFAGTGSAIFPSLEAVTAENEISVAFSTSS